VSATDHFSGQARQYRRFRPGYPRALVECLADLTADHGVVWDCGTGSGQAAIALAARFDRVIATDASREQIAQADPHPGVRYLVCRAEECALDDRSMDLVTVAQALHWFELERFYREVRRVARRGGVLAAWCYTLLEIEPEIDGAIRRFHEGVASFWPSERALVEARYRDLPFPFEEIRAPALAMVTEWNRMELLGYVDTWSALRNFRRKRAVDPLPALADELARVWQDPRERKSVRFPLHFRIGRLR
jgi:SAM-dependent methyltransferase